MELTKDMEKKLAERLINALYRIRDLDEQCETDQTYMRGITVLKEYGIDIEN